MTLDSKAGAQYILSGLPRSVPEAGWVALAGPADIAEPAGHAWTSVTSRCLFKGLPAPSPDVSWVAPVAVPSLAS